MSKDINFNETGKFGSVLVGDGIRESIKELMGCPIVKELQQELLGFGLNIQTEYEDNFYTFMTNVNREHSKRGGKPGKTLGAVAQAILLLTQEKGE